MGGKAARKAMREISRKERKRRKAKNRIISRQGAMTPSWESYFSYLCAFAPLRENSLN
jgi:hypothetical protein